MDDNEIWRKISSAVEMGCSITAGTPEKEENGADKVNDDGLV